MPQVNCSSIVDMGALCPHCLARDVDDALVLSWALNLEGKKDHRLTLIGAGQTFGNANVVSSTMALKKLLSLKGWNQTSNLETEYDRHRMPNAELWREYS